MVGRHQPRIKESHLKRSRSDRSRSSQVVEKVATVQVVLFGKPVVHAERGLMVAHIENARPGHQKGSELNRSPSYRDPVVGRSADSTWVVGG